MTQLTLNLLNDLEPTGEMTTSSSPVGSRSCANPTQWQESERAKRMRDISGRKCLEQLEKFTPVGLWARTFLELLIGQEGWYSTRCRLTWKLKGTKYNRLYCQLYPSTLPTDGTGFGLLLTPSTVDIGITDGRVEKRTAYRNSIGRQYVPGCLTEQIHGLLPTPDCSDRRSDNSTQWGLSNFAKNQMLPTPREAAARDNTSNDRGKGNLEDAIAKLLPTPAARDWKGSRSTEALEESGRNETNSLPDAFAQTGKTSQLSPLFVTEMMGFPIDWLVSPFLNGETNQ